MKIINKNISGTTYDKIKNRIINVDYKPGSLLSENELALEFGVSRTPIKNALIRLEHANLVDVVPQKGTFVTKIKSHEVNQYLEMRCYLEIVAVEKIIANGVSKEFMAKLEKNIEMQIEVRNDVSSTIESRGLKFRYLDDQMHMIIFNESNLELLWSHIMTDYPNLARYRVLSTNHSEEYINLKIQDHEQIYKLFENNTSTEEVKKTYIEHVLEGLDERIENLAQKYESYFI